MFRVRPPDETTRKHHNLRSYDDDLNSQKIHIVGIALAILVDSSCNMSWHFFGVESFWRELKQQYVPRHTSVICWRENPENTHNQRNILVNNSNLPSTPLHGNMFTTLIHQMAPLDAFSFGVLARKSTSFFPSTRRLHNNVENKGVRIERGH